MRYIVKTTPKFDKWLNKVKDKIALANIITRINSISELGNFGDYKVIDKDISELRVFVGKGYRIYYTVQKNTVVILLNGGNKSNKKSQQNDINAAKELIKTLE